MTTSRIVLTGIKGWVVARNRVTGGQVWVTQRKG